MKKLDEYLARELQNEIKFLQSRNSGGKWKTEEAPSIETCVERISWLLNGDYGKGAQLYALRLIDNNLEGKKGKNIDKAWLSIGKRLILLVALHDTSEYNSRKITELWYVAGIDFAYWNSKAVGKVLVWRNSLSKEE